MRAVIQRVTEGSVTVNNEIVSLIRQGLVVLLGIAKGDTSEDVDFLINKIATLRILEDQQDKMNLSVLDIGAEVLVVSQFTLVADIRIVRINNDGPVTFVVDSRFPVVS